MIRSCEVDFNIGFPGSDLREGQRGFGSPQSKRFLEGISNRSLVEIRRIVEYSVDKYKKIREKLIKHEFKTKTCDKFKRILFPIRLASMETNYLQYCEDSRLYNIIL